MRNIKIALWGFLLLTTGLWLLADTLWPQPLSYFAFRGVFVQYSGVIAIGAMSISMLLSVRPVWLERTLNGLDKMYRLHKWLGIVALVSSLLHWWWAKGSKWMVGWGWLERPARGGPPGNATQIASTLETWLRSQRGFAEELGEKAFYIALILLVLALVKYFPYRLFIKTHKWLALAYLALVYHTVVLTKMAYWSQPIGWVLALMLLAGTVSSLLVLFKRVGKSRQVSGSVAQVAYIPELKVTRTDIRLTPGWKGHRSGQFAFVSAFSDERAHPYTLSSAWDPKNPMVQFITKALGDHTSTLHERLKPGMPVTVEGPYGCFTFDDTPPRQIWVGGGIGITPFIARLKEIAQRGEQAPNVDLFHCTTDYDPPTMALLQADADAAGIRLHVLHTRNDGHLSGKNIRMAVPEWPNASIWFCGPADFAQALRSDFNRHGFPMQHFHQELFAMR